jgi:hypothetical protein
MKRTRTTAGGAEAFETITVQRPGLWAGSCGNRRTQTLLPERGTQPCSCIELSTDNVAPYQVRMTILMAAELGAFTRTSKV